MIPLVLALLLLTAILELANRPGRVIPAVAAAILAGLLAWRGWQVAFLPLTNKYEAFLAFALAMLGVTLYRWRTLGRAGRLLLLGVTAAFVGTPLAWDDALHYPSPLLVTAWYAVHVPLSFVAYGFWLTAGANGLDHLFRGSDEPTLRARQESNVRTGLVLFSLAMIFGSIWGVVSWGAYFLWDAKILWSLAAWVYFATFAHVRYVRTSAGARVAAGFVGFVLVLGTYVGTSFMKGSIHAF